jgi:hypothetical protein
MQKRNYNSPNFETHSLNLNRMEFFNSFLQLFEKIITAIQSGTPESKPIAINLIMLGIASIPDPENITRPPIYENIEKEIELQKKANPDATKEQIQDFEYTAYMRYGQAGIVSWLNRMGMFTIGGI